MLVHRRRDKIVSGALQVTRAVEVTYGPCGRTVMLDRFSGLLSSRDGVTVACEVEPSDPVERVGALALRHACIQINEEVGDGTSTTVLLAGKLIELGHKHIVAGVDPGELSVALENMVPLSLLKLMKIEVKDVSLLEQVALHTTKGDTEVAQALAQASMLVGKTGMVVVEDGKGRGVEVVPKHGMEIDGGWESSDFSQDGEPWERDVTLVAVIDGTVTKFEDVAPLMEAASSVGPGNLPLLVVSRGMYGEALQTMVVNHRKEVLSCCGVRAPKYGPKMRGWLEDLAALSQAQVVDTTTGMKLCEFESGWLGSVQQVSVTASSATLVCFDDAFESIEARVAVLRMERDREESVHDREQITERIAKLTDGFCVLRVGAVTESEAKERRGRVEDALHAVRAALSEGVVPGAGMAYFWLAWYLEGERERMPDHAHQVALQILCEALREPLRALVRNAGYEAPVVLEGLSMASDPLSAWAGFDAVTGSYRSLGVEPVLADPLAVVRTAIETAVSVARMLLTAEVAITRSR